ncbi:hypothetical protein KDL29_02510 [bacterium]|nr:hypothetical protein [bacterium]
MSPETRRFYTAYRLQTSIIPVYLLTALFFLLGWYFNPFISGRNGGIIFGGVVLFVGISRLASLAGFLLSQVPRSIVQPDKQQQLKLGDLVPEGGLPMQVNLLDLGPVPYLAAGGLLPQVWISTYSLQRLSVEELRCLLEHEQSHLRRGCSFQWLDLLWLLAWSLAWLLSSHAPMYVASAIVFAWAWLRLQGWLRWHDELRADKAAAQACGRDNYARAIARHLAEFEAVPSSPLRRSRLAALGLSPAEIDGVLQD